MHSLTVSESRRHAHEAARHAAAQADEAAEPAVPASRMIARARWLMIISGSTTLIALAAVIGIIGYRIFHAGGIVPAPPAEAIVTLPKGARILATTVTEERIAVTLDIAGAMEIRTFDAKTLKETARIRFATEP